MAVFSSSETNEHLTKLPGWLLKDNAIEKEWVFKDFNQALQFINKVGDIAEKHNHHPELYNVYSKVILRFNTHDEGGITQKDINIACEINMI